jgi:hypothetical protein
MPVHGQFFFKKKINQKQISSVESQRTKRKAVLCWNAWKRSSKKHSECGILEQSSPGQFLVRDRAGKADVHQAPYGKSPYNFSPFTAFLSCFDVDQRTQSAAHDNLQRKVLKSSKILLLREAKVQ